MGIPVRQLAAAVNDANADGDDDDDDAETDDFFPTSSATPSLPQPSPLLPPSPALAE